MTAMAGGMMVLCWVAWREVIKELFVGAGDLLFGRKWSGRRRDRGNTVANPLKRKMPYAPAIAVGTLISFFAH